MPELVKKQLQELRDFINDEMIVQSLLYDMNLLPEQLEEGSKEFAMMVNIVCHFKSFKEETLKK